MVDADRSEAEPRGAGEPEGSEPADSADDVASVEEVTFALQFARVMARVIDLGLVGIIAMVVLLVADAVLGLGLVTEGEPRDVALFYLGWWPTVVVLGWPYEVVLVGWRGRTLGKWAVGVKVVRSDRADAPGLARSRRRASRQLLLWIVVPLGVVWVLRLLAVERRQAWYDRSCGTAVCWAVPAGSRRRRFWSWPDERTNQRVERYVAIIWSVSAATAFCGLARPPSMQEAAAVRAIELLMTANVVGLGVFVATSGLVVRYVSSVGSRGSPGSMLGVSILALGTVSLFGILLGAGYVATQPSAMADISHLRHVLRLMVFLLLVCGVAMLAAMWIVQLEAEHEIKDSTADDPEQPPEEESAAT